jgi:hypothetical protein
MIERKEDLKLQNAEPVQCCSIIRHQHIIHRLCGEMYVKVNTWHDYKLEKEFKSIYLGNESTYENHFLERSLSVHKFSFTEV